MPLTVKNSQEFVTTSPTQKIGYRGCFLDALQQVKSQVRLQHRSAALPQSPLRSQSAQVNAASEIPNTAGRLPPRGASTFVNQVLKLTNAARRKVGLNPLKTDPRLMQAAQAHSEDMALNDFYEHTGSNGFSFSDRIKAAGYPYTAAAENIAAGNATPKTVVKAWLNSPDHRTNMLNPGLKEIGIGFYFLGNDTGNIRYEYYWTQDFGTAAANRRSQRRTGNP